MKVIAITPHQKHDYLASTIIEGLYDLNIKVIASDEGNGVKKVYTEEEIIKESKNSNYILAFWSKKINPAPQYHLLKKINLPHKTAYIDGSEWTATGYYDTPLQHIEALRNPSRRKGTPWINEEMLQYVQWYFKRECFPEDKKRGIIPLPFGAVKEYFHKPVNKNCDFLCAFGQTYTGLRASVQRISKDYRKINKKIEIGPFELNLYKQKLSESIMIADAWGSGECNARFFESVANKVCVIHQKNNIIIPFEYEDGITSVEFTNIEEFKNKLDYYLNNLEEAKKIGENAYVHTLKYHTSKERVKYMVEMMQ